jgi:hypothetical protein
VILLSQNHRLALLFLAFESPLPPKRLQLKLKNLERETLRDFAFAKSQTRAVVFSVRVSSPA